jgi:hypothetical protein
MKKRNLIIAGIIAIIVVAIAFTGIFYPSAFQKGAEGTIAKVEKYHKQQMSEADVLMRSKILSDTTTLKETINGLIVFNAFAGKMSENMDNTVEYLQGSDLSGNQDILKNLDALKGYSDFIKNNNVILDRTINVLLDHYQSKTTSTSADIENDLREFSNFVYQITQKDSILDLFIARCDKNIGDIEIFKTKEKELENLKKIRDNLLLDNVQFAYLVGDASKLGVLCDKPLYNIDQLGMGSSSSGLQNVVIANQQKLQRILSADQLKSITLNNLDANAILGSIDKNMGSWVVCNSDKLNVFVLDKASLNGIICSSTELLNLFGDRYGQLNAILALEGLRVIVYDRDKLQFMESQLTLGDVFKAQDMYSGIILCDKDALQKVISGQDNLKSILQSEANGNLSAINSMENLGRLLAVDALKFKLAAIANKGLLNCALSRSELGNVLKNNQPLGDFMAAQQLNVKVCDKGTLSAFNDQSLGIKANSSLENILSNQIGNMYANKLNFIILDRPNLGFIVFDKANLGNSDALKNAIGNNISSMQAILSSFPSSLGVVTDR